MTEELIIHGGPTYSGSLGQRCDTVKVAVKGKTYCLMIDCGMEFQREGEVGGAGTAPDFSLISPNSVDAVFMTHSHADHVGSIAHVFRRDLNLLRPDAKIYSSPQTAAIMPFVLQDGLKNNGGAYTVFEAIKVLERREIIPSPGEFEILPGLKVFIPQVGHIPGAGGIVIPTSSGKKGLIMGDGSWHDQPVTKGALLPSKAWPREWIPDEIWGTDLTYGFGQRRPVWQEVDRLVAQTKIAHGAGKNVVLATLGIGKTQNVAYWLSKAGISCYLDGMGRYIYRIFQEVRWSERDNKLPQLGAKSGILPVQSAEHREEIINAGNTGNPVVVITTGGMGDFGPIVRYMREWLGKSEACFYFTSYLMPGTNGDKLVRLAKKRSESDDPSSFKFLLKDEKTGFQQIPFRASVDRFGLSAHGDMNESVAFVQDIVSCRGGEKLLKIVLTHGSPESKTAAALRLRPLAREIIWGERNTVIRL